MTYWVKIIKHRNEREAVEEVTCSTESNALSTFMGTVTKETKQLYLHAMGKADTDVYTEVSMFANGIETQRMRISAGLSNVKPKRVYEDPVQMAANRAYESMMQLHTLLKQKP